MWLGTLYFFLTGILFASSFLLFDYLSEKKLSSKVINLLIIFILLLVFTAILYSIIIYGFSLNTVLIILGLGFAFLLIGGMTGGIYSYGIKNGEKYWRNHVEKFYAYGVGVLILLGLSIYLVVGNAFCRPSDELAESNNLSLYDLAFYVLDLSVFFLPSYWFGVFVGNRKKILENRINIQQ